MRKARKLNRIDHFIKIIILFGFLDVILRPLFEQRIAPLKNPVSYPFVGLLRSLSLMLSFTQSGRSFEVSYNKEVLSWHD